MRVDRDVLAVGRVAVLRALGLGDLLVAVPALRALAAARRATEPLRLVTPLALAPLVRLIPGAERLDVVGADGLRSVPAPAREADLAINLHGSGPQSHELLLASGARALVAFAGPGAPGGPAWDDGEHEAHRWCRLLRGAGLDADPAALDLELPAGVPDHPLRDATVLHPGAASRARRWPPERFAAVARAELAAGRRVVVTGGPDEVALARAVADAAGLGAEAVLAGRTSLAELAALVAAAGRVVCGDTGVSHLATAFGTPSVVLFGPTPPRTWGPPPWRAERHRVLWAGQHGDPHADAPDPGLLRIQAERVLDELARIDS